MPLFTSAILPPQNDNPAWNIAERYLNVSDERYQASNIGKHSYSISPINGKQSWYVRALKVASYFTIILPLLALGIRSAYRFHCSFNQKIVLSTLYLHVSLAPNKPIAPKEASKTLIPASAPQIKEKRIQDLAALITHEIESISNLLRDRPKSQKQISAIGRYLAAFSIKLGELKELAPQHSQLLAWEEKYWQLLGDWLNCSNNVNPLCSCLDEEGDPRLTLHIRPCDIADKNSSQ